MSNIFEHFQRYRQISKKNSDCWVKIYCTNRALRYCMLYVAEERTYFCILCTFYCILCRVWVRGCVGAVNPLCRLKTSDPIAEGSHFVFVRSELWFFGLSDYIWSILESSAIICNKQQNNRSSSTYQWLVWNICHIRSKGERKTIGHSCFILKLL